MHCGHHLLDTIGLIKPWDTKAGAIQHLLKQFTQVIRRPILPGELRIKQGFGAINDIHKRALTKEILVGPGTSKYRIKNSLGQVGIWAPANQTDVFLLDHYPVSQGHPRRVNSLTQGSKSLAGRNIVEFDALSRRTLGCTPVCLLETHSSPSGNLNKFAPISIEAVQNQPRDVVRLMFLNAHWSLNPIVFHETLSIMALPNWSYQFGRAISV